MFIETEGTPNPATLKFLPGRDVMGAGTADFATAGSADRSPLAHALFQLPGVARVFLGGDFITVTKSDLADWQTLRPEVLGAVMEHFVAGRPVMDGASDAMDEDVAPEDREVVEQIKELLDTRVRPAVASDGGDIVFRGYREGVVLLHMQGACSGCPSILGHAEAWHREHAQALRARGRVGAAGRAVGPCRRSTRAPGGRCSPTPGRSTSGVPTRSPTRRCEEMYRLLRMGPTSANCSPARFLFLRRPRRRSGCVRPCRPATSTRPCRPPWSPWSRTTRRSTSSLPKLFPHADARAWFAGNEALATETALRNGTLQGAYLIMAARAVGLDAGPMSGFDKGRVDAAFFAASGWKANFLVNLGHGDASRAASALAPADVRRGVRPALNAAAGAGCGRRLLFGRAAGRRALPGGAPWGRQPGRDVQLARHGADLLAEARRRVRRRRGDGRAGKLHRAARAPWRWHTGWRSVQRCRSSG